CCGRRGNRFQNCAPLAPRSTYLQLRRGTCLRGCRKSCVAAQCAPTTNSHMTSSMYKRQPPAQKHWRRELLNLFLRKTLALRFKSLKSTIGNDGRWITLNEGGCGIFTED